MVRIHDWISFHPANTRPDRQPSESFQDALARAIAALTSQFNARVNDA
jgi:hypothetical protein